jgi:nitrite reductase/ring-hydroxylating ferredoxin subunit
VAELDVCPVEELPSCSVKIVYAGEIAVGVYNLNGEYYALEDLWGDVPSVSVEAISA